MQHGDDWLRGIGADLRKYAVEAFTAAMKREAKSAFIFSQRGMHRSPALGWRSIHDAKVRAWIVEPGLAQQTAID